MLYSDDSAFLSTIDIVCSYILWSFLYKSSMHLIIPLVPLVFSYEDSDMVVSVDRFSVFE